VLCVFVCLCLCLSVPQAYLWNFKCNFLPSFQACYVWPWLGRALSLLRYVVYFQLVGDVMFADDD